MREVYDGCQGRALIRQGCAGTTISLGEGIAKEAPQFIAFEIK